MKQVIGTKNAPQAIGAYSQAIKSGSMIFLSGQIGFSPTTMELVEGGITAQVHQVMLNLAAVAKAAGGSLANIVKLTVYLTDLKHADVVNSAMREFMEEPYPARVMIQVSALPRGAIVEIDGTMVL